LGYDGRKMQFYLVMCCKASNTDIWDSQTLSGAWVAQWVRSLDLTAHTSLSPIWRGFAPSCPVIMFYSEKFHMTSEVFTTFMCKVIDNISRHLIFCHFHTIS
jgi:hypothetical protein